jgi:hypothetical protein
VNPDRVSVVRHGMGIRLLLAQPEPCVRCLQIPDLLAPFSFELKHAAPAEAPEQRRIERLAPFDIGHDQVEMMDPTRLHGSMLSPRAPGYLRKSTSPTSAACSRRVIVDEHRAVRLEDEEAHGLGQDGRQPSCVVNLAAGDD